MSDRQRRLEEGFFAASTDAVVMRADAFSDLDPKKRPERSERRVFLVALVAVGAVMAVLGALAPAPSPVVEKTSAGATSAPARGTAVRPPPARPDSARLAALLGVGGEAGAPPVQAPAAPATAAAPVSAAAVAADSRPDPLAAARARLADGDFEGVVASLAEAEATTEVWTMRGQALYELGRDGEALSALRAALADDPRHGPALLLLGSLQQSADPAAAAQTYRAYLEAHPEAPQAQEVRQILERI